MRTHYDPEPRRPHIVVPEPDDYLEHAEEPPELEPSAPWISHLFQPAVVSILVGCITWPIARLAGSLVPGQAITLLWLAPVVMAFIGFRTQLTVMKRFLTSGDSLRFRLIELAVLYLLVKVLSHFDNTLPELVDILRSWAQDPMSFFDTESAVAFAIGTMAWLAAGLTARDLQALRDPTMYLGETEPRQRLASRYFLGGAALLIVTTLANVSLGRVLQSGVTRVRRPIFNVLLYFFLGLIMLGQVNLTRLTGAWKREKVTIAENLGATWIRYTLLFVALAAVVAFLLPTGYTIGILDLVATLALLISYVATVIYLLLLWPITALLSLLMGESPDVRPPKLEQPPLLPPPEAAEGLGANPWWAVARSVIFWGVLLTVVVYLVRSYLRDRPDLFEKLKQFALWQWISAAWRELRRWIRGVGRTLQTTVPQLVARLRAGRRASAGARRRRRGRDLREQLFYHYLRTLDTAKERGVPRRGPETPYEYRKTLTPHLAEGVDALEQLTEAFVEARYSDHPLTPEAVKAQEANAERVRRSLRKPETDE